MKMKKKKNKILLLIIFAFVIIIGTLIMVFAIANKPPQTTELIDISDISRQEDIDTLLRSQFQPLRNYGLGVYKNNSFNVDGIFNKLPPIPYDLWRYIHLLSTGKITGDILCELTLDHYTQPELYPNFVKQHIKQYIHPDTYHWTPRGHGTYPADMETIMAQGDFVEVCTFLHTAFGVETYQGFGIIPIYPTKFTYKDVDYTQNPEQVKEYLTVEITPKNVLLEPAYLMFEPGWSKKITIKVTSRADTPPGIYQIGFNPTRPDLDVASEWESTFKNKFRNGPGGFGVDRPQFLMVVRIEPKT